MAARAAQSPHTRVGIVTVSYGSGADLQRFLASVRTHCGDIAIAVVDNKPGSDGVEAIAAAHQALYLPRADNPGYGAGMNAGSAMLDVYARDRGEAPFAAYFVCNPDVVFTENTATVLASALRELREDAAGQFGAVGAVGPLLKNDDGSVYPSARNVPSVGLGVGHALFVNLWPSNPWTARYKSADDYAHRRTAGWLSGAAVMVRADVWRELGGFDERYFLNFEDIDLGYRIGLAGFTNVLVPETSVIHSGGHSLKHHAEVSERAMHTSAIRFMRKRYAGFWRTPIRWAVVMGLKLRGALRVRSARRASA